jgi:hypothetical protein
MGFVRTTRPYFVKVYMYDNGAELHSCHIVPHPSAICDIFNPKVIQTCLHSGVSLVSACICRSFRHGAAFRLDRCGGNDGVH